MEISENIQKENLTVLEKQTIQSLINDLYAEPGFSDVSPQDLSRLTKIPMKSLRGVLGSLVQKGYVSIADGKDMDIEYDIVYLDESFYYLHPTWSN
jgi:DNA-binding IscR family transcriptional regulator